jgi:GT2 family glycosyltransferase
VLPVVSFVVPVRNDVLRLQRCLASIVRNDYPRELIEIIVVDHNSTDGSAAAARIGGAVVLQGAGSSVAALRNQGARVALGGILAFVDADHEIAACWIRTVVDVLADSSVAAAGAAYSPQPSANWVQRQYDGLRRRPLRREEVTWLGSGNFAVRRSVFDRVGGFDASLTACEDVDFCNRVRQAGYRLIADPDVQSVHFGDPPTLKALFFGELWRGRDNLRVTFAGPRTFRNLRSALIPLANLVCLIAALVALFVGDLVWTGTLAAISLVPAAATAALILKRQLHPGITTAAQAFVVATVFALARALALVVGGTHRARRVA